MDTVDTGYIDLATRGGGYPLQEFSALVTWKEHTNFKQSNHLKVLKHQ